jgi:hypothetical protein
MDENDSNPKRKTHTSSQVKRRYIEKVYSRIHADLPKELVAKFRELTKANGDTTAGVFRATLKRYIEEHQPES